MNGIGFTLLLSVLLLAGCATNNVRNDDSEAANTAYTRLGIEYLQGRDLQGAKAAFQKALSIEPSDAEAYNGLALTFQVEGEFALAEQYFRKAVSYSPQSAMIHNNFGAFLYARQRYEEACQVLGRATEDPFYNRRAQAFENLGRCYRLLNNAAAAEHAFERAIQISPARYVSLVEISDILVAQLRWQEAAVYFERFTALVDARRAEHYAKSLWVGIRLAREQNKPSQAATYALLLKNLYPNSEEYRLFEESAR